VRKLILFSFALLTMAIWAAPASPGSAQADDTLRAPFVGAWRLAWLEEPDATGKIYRADCSGLLIYTPDGHMSVQVMYRDPQSAKGAAPAQYSQGGYEASYGTYEVNDAQTFTFHVEGALVRSLIGKDLKRVYEFSGKQLIVKSPDPNERWRVAWERSKEGSR